MRSNTLANRAVVSPISPVVPAGPPPPAQSSPRPGPVKGKKAPEAVPPQQRAKGGRFCFDAGGSAEPPSSATFPCGANGAGTRRRLLACVNPALPESLERKDPHLDSLEGAFRETGTRLLEGTILSRP
jgi:hypothetical protein